MLFFKFKCLCYMIIVLLLCPTVYLCFLNDCTWFPSSWLKKQTNAYFGMKFPMDCAVFVSLEKILIEVKAMKGNCWTFENLVSIGFHVPKKSALALKLSRHRARLRRLMDGKGGCLCTLEDFSHSQSKLEHPWYCCHSTYNKPAWD